MGLFDTKTLDSPRVTVLLRATQIFCSLVSFVCALTLTSGWQWQLALGVCAAWGSSIPVFITVLILVFFRRPLEYWSFTTTLDLLAMLSALSAFGCVCGTFYYLSPQGIVAAVLTFTSATLHCATATRTFLLYRRRFLPQSSDPLKPYLMKKEIDVWCYPVQNEQGQLFMDYEPVSSSGASKAPSEHSTRARSVKSFVRVDDEPPDTARPNSEVETTAGWSVPSQNETLQRSERGSTVPPSYRSMRASGRPGAGDHRDSQPLRPSDTR